MPSTTMTIGDVFQLHQRQFREIFGAPLSQYWDSVHGGFLMQAFCTQVLEYEGLYPHSATKSKFGIEGQRLIREIVRGVGATW